jgi:glucose dehydrogenase
MCSHSTRARDGISTAAAAGLSGSGPPATYSIKGRQFVVVTSTGNKLGQQSEYGDAYVAFALP